ncbi:hypothetical protein D3C78_1577370 [compost metagenome]
MVAVSSWVSPAFPCSSRGMVQLALCPGLSTKPSSRATGVIVASSFLSTEHRLVRSVVSTPPTTSFRVLKVTSSTPAASTAKVKVNFTVRVWLVSPVSGTLMGSATFNSVMFESTSLMLTVALSLPVASSFSLS